MNMTKIIHTPYIIILGLAVFLLAHDICLIEDKDIVEKIANVTVLFCMFFWSCLALKENFPK